MLKDDLRNLLHTKIMSLEIDGSAQSIYAEHKRELVDFKAEITNQYIGSRRPFNWRIKYWNEGLTLYIQKINWTLTPQQRGFLSIYADQLALVGNGGSLKVLKYLRDSDTYRSLFGTVEPLEAYDKYLSGG